jgi:hypothetical protein
VDDDASADTRRSARSLPAPASTRAVSVSGWSHSPCSDSSAGPGRRCGSSSTSTRGCRSAFTSVRSASPAPRGRRLPSSRGIREHPAQFRHRRVHTNVDPADPGRVRQLGKGVLQRDGLAVAGVSVQTHNRPHRGGVRNGPQHRPHSRRVHHLASGTSTGTCARGFCSRRNACPPAPSLATTFKPSSLSGSGLLGPATPGSRPVDYARPTRRSPRITRCSVDADGPDAPPAAASSQDLHAGAGVLPPGPVEAVRNSAWPLVARARVAVRDFAGDVRVVGFTVFRFPLVV